MTLQDLRNQKQNEIQNWKKRTHTHKTKRRKKNSGHNKLCFMQNEKSCHVYIIYSQLGTHGKKWTIKLQLKIILKKKLSGHTTLYFGRRISSRTIFFFVDHLVCVCVCVFVQV